MTPNDFDHALELRNALIGKMMSRRVGYGRAKLYRHPKRRALRK